MYGIPIFEITPPSGDLIEAFPVGPDGRVVVHLPTDSAILVDEQVYCKFFSVNGIDNPPAFTGIQACLGWGAVQLRAYNVDIVIFAPDEKPA